MDEMHTEFVLDCFRREFPGRRIVCLPERSPKEIIVEVGKEVGKSVAVAVIERSKPHFHRRTTEHYVVEEGVLHLHVGRRSVILRQGESFTIKPRQKHWATGKGDVFARVRVIASPPWSPDDHILCA